MNKEQEEFWKTLSLTEEVKQKLEILQDFKKRTGTDTTDMSEPILKIAGITNTTDLREMTDEQLVSFAKAAVQHDKRDKTLMEEMFEAMLEVATKAMIKEQVKKILEQEATKPLPPPPELAWTKMNPSWDTKHGRKK